MSPTIALPTATLDLNAIDGPKLLQQGQPHQPPIPHAGHVAYSPRQDLSSDPRSPPSLPISKHSQVCAPLRCLPAKSGTVAAPDPSHFHGFSLGPQPTCTDRLLLLPSDIATPHFSFTYTGPLSCHSIFSATYTDLPSFFLILSVPCTDACYQLLSTSGHFLRSSFLQSFLRPRLFPNGKTRPFSSAFLRWQAQLDVRLSSPRPQPQPSRRTSRLLRRLFQSRSPPGLVAAVTPFHRLLFPSPISLPTAPGRLISVCSLKPRNSPHASALTASAAPEPQSFHLHFQPRLKWQRQTALRALIGPFLISKSGPQRVARSRLSSETRKGVVGTTKKYEKRERKKGEFHLLLHSRIFGGKYCFKLILIYLACD